MLKIKSDDKRHVIRISAHGDGFSLVNEALNAVNAIVKTFQDRREQGVIALAAFRSVLENPKFWGDEVKEPEVQKDAE